MLRVLVVDESAERADTLREGLARAGHEVVASLSSPLELLRAVERAQPDVIIIDTESPTRDVLAAKTQADLEQIRNLLCDGVHAGKPKSVLDGW